MLNQRAYRRVCRFFYIAQSIEPLEQRQLINGVRFDYLNAELRKMNADFIDEHYYRKPEWFFANAKRYDNYPRNSSKIFSGEYAAQSDYTGSGKNKTAG